LFKDNHFHNFVLIGMAGAGKSTVAPRLAHALQTGYVDTDDLIAASQSATLQQVLDSLGPAEFQALEEKTLLSINLRNHVIATGGSAIYSRPAMEHLQKIACIIWLDVELAVLEERVTNIDSRGLINPNGMTFGQLYFQRQKLYRQFADLRISCAARTPEEVAEEIVALTVDNPGQPATLD
jgi:shikimate kinase